MLVEWGWVGDEGECESAREREDGIESTHGDPDYDSRPHVQNTRSRSTLELSIKQPPLVHTKRAPTVQSAFRIELR